jgi:hypothetical protein
MLQILYNNNLACVMVILTIFSLVFFPVISGTIFGMTLLYNALGVLAFALEPK